MRARGHFPTDKQAALRCLYLVTRSLNPTGHFALEDKAAEIAALMRDFLARVVPRA